MCRDFAGQAVMVPTPTPTLPIRLALEAKASAAAIGMLGGAHPQGKPKFKPALVANLPVRARSDVYDAAACVVEQR